MTDAPRPCDAPEPPPVTLALQLADEADEALHDATEVLVSTSPTTVAGVAATLVAVAEFVTEHDRWDDRFLTASGRLPKLLRRLAGTLNGEAS